MGIDKPKMINCAHEKYRFFKNPVAVIIQFSGRIEMINSDRSVDIVIFNAIFSMFSPVEWLLKKTKLLDVFVERIHEIILQLFLRISQVIANAQCHYVLYCFFVDNGNPNQLFLADSPVQWWSKKGSWDQMFAASLSIDHLVEHVFLKKSPKNPAAKMIN